MNTIKKHLGLVWMALSPILIVFMCWQAAVTIGQASQATKANTILQWSIILAVFIPICLGLFLFGKYAWQNEYEHLPESSSELKD